MSFANGNFGARCLAASLGALAALACGGASADPIRHPTVVFAGLDKTTGRIINFDVAIDETVAFGSLQVTPRVCNTRPQTETPQTTSFVEVDEQAGKPEQKGAKSEAKRIFSGWMFAASPGLHGVEHPVYDVWLVDCKGGKEVVAQPAAAVAPPSEAAAPPPAAESRRGRRSRRVEPTTPAPVENQPIGPSDQAAPPVDAAAPAATGAPDAAAPAAQQAEKPKRKKKSRRAGQPDGPAVEPTPSGPPLLPF
jgi:hypothetical protein